MSWFLQTHRPRLAHPIEGFRAWRYWRSHRITKADRAAIAQWRNEMHPVRVWHRSDVPSLASRKHADNEGVTNE